MHPHVGFLHSQNDIDGIQATPQGWRFVGNEHSWQKLPSVEAFHEELERWDSESEVCLNKAF